MGKVTEMTQAQAAPQVAGRLASLTAEAVALRAMMTTAITGQACPPLQGRLPLRHADVCLTAPKTIALRIAKRRG